MVQLAALHLYYYYLFTRCGIWLTIVKPPFFLAINSLLYKEAQQYG